MNVQDMYIEFREAFADLSCEADQEHAKSWGEASLDTAYVWFESLASALNNEMHNESEPKKNIAVFEFFRSKYLAGNVEIQECIDVSFTQNIFWNVQPEKAEQYWLVLPDLLKDLYVKFHHRKPV